ncbi:MAG: hypothetical protein KOO63_03885 [Bacteroidales bacterium]|nr:hypothetical protein [Candidatus Latescibacterota bacterium]
MAFQIQAKDSVLAFGPFATINAVQNLNLDPTFNEENFSELGNVNYTATSRMPETSGSFEVTSTGSIASILARMLYSYTTQEYAYTAGTNNNYTITEADFENCIFDVINLKAPGTTFDEAVLVPNAQLTGMTLRLDATGVGSETFSFEADLQESLATPYHDLVTVPLDASSTDGTTATIPTAFNTIDSGTHAIVYVFVDNQKYDDTVADWTSDDTVTLVGSAMSDAAPFERVSAVLAKRTPGTMPTITYPTDARFVKGDRADIWLINSGTVGVDGLTDSNRLLRCQSVDISIDLSRDKLSEIRRNNDLSTTYFRGLNYPLDITVNVSILETGLAQYAALQNKTLDSAASMVGDVTIDTNNVMNLVDFDPALDLYVKYYKTGNDNPLCTVTMTTLGITAFSERQVVQGRGERTLSFIGSNITIDGDDL